MPIIVNPEAIEALIQSEVTRAVDECQAAANSGKSSIYFTTSRDIQRELRNRLEDTHKIFVPTKFYQGSTPSHKVVEHNGDETEMKLVW